MTWPMHDAGSTTPETGPDPGPESLDPGHDDLGYDDPGRPRRGRHAAPDPLPPLDGPMPGGGPSPAETTLPLALKWPAPPTSPHHRPGAPGSPPGWRRVPRTSDPNDPERTQNYPPQPTFTPTRPGAPGPPGPPGGGPPGPRGPAGARRAGAPPVQAGPLQAGPLQAGPAATQRSSLVRSGAGMAIGTLVSRGTGFLRTLVLVAAIGTSFLGNAYNNANTLPNTVYYL